MPMVLLLWGAAALILSIGNYLYWRAFPDTEDNEGIK